MRSTGRSSTVVAALLTVLLTALVAAGCTGLPDSGPVVDSRAPSEVDEQDAPAVNAVPPERGAPAIDIARGFLKAMTAWPPKDDVARQFLTASAASEWDPAAATITYAGQLPAQDRGTRVTLPLTDAERLGPTGSWLGRLTEAEQTLELELTVEQGQYRINNPPDALVVPDYWFTQRYRQASLFFFDPSGRILVPEPVFVPRGGQLPSTLISRLLRGPGPGLQRVSRSFVPPGLRVEVSVPVSLDGVATVPLVGEPGALTPGVTEKLLAQVAWTLRQDPAIRAVRVSLGGQVLRGPSGDDEYAVGEADPYDPNGFPASENLFALRDGVLAVRDGNELRAVPGGFGTGDLDLRTAALNLEATRAAAVTRDGRQLLVTGLETPAIGARGKVLRPLRGTDLLRPAWDFADRIWVVDRTSSGAVVRHVTDGRARPIGVSGVSGRDVRSFLVSRDGTRLVAVVRGVEGDQVRVGRIQVDDRGALDSVATTEVIGDQPGVQVRIRDIAWTSPTTIAVLSPVEPGTFGVRTVSVDGSPPSTEALGTTITEPVVGLAGSPVVDQPTYGVTQTGLIDLTDGGSYGFVGSPASALGYVG